MHTQWVLFILQFQSYETVLSWCLKWASFPICVFGFAKICLIITSSNKYLQYWSFKLAKSNQFKANKSRSGLMWNADMWLTNLSKAACTTLSHIQMLNQIAKFNTWMFISGLHQHNINAIKMHFKYLIWQFNSTSECDPISAVDWDLSWNNLIEYWKKGGVIGND